MNQLDEVETEIDYPSSDGEPMAENTLQYLWIVMIQMNLDLLFRERPDVFVAGDNLIYPVRGDNKTRMAPDVYVAFGRPKGHRGSYQVWREDKIFPQVVFEVLPPGNRAAELARKLQFYSTYGAQEYYIYDPDRNRLIGYFPEGDELIEHELGREFTSPLLGITFHHNEEDLLITNPDGTPFRDHLETAWRSRQLDSERQRADAEQDRAEEERQRAEEAVSLQKLERERAERLAARLRELGIDPDTV